MNDLHFFVLDSNKNVINKKEKIEEQTQRIFLNTILKYSEIIYDSEYVDLTGYVRFRIIKYKNVKYIHKMINGRVVEFIKID